MATALCAMTEKPEMPPLLMLPKPRAGKVIMMVADISKPVLYVLDKGGMTSCRTPSCEANTNMMGMSMKMKRALKKTDMAALARPYRMTQSKTG